MAVSQNQSENRMLFFDTIRSFIILLVVVFHVALSYCSYSQRWAVSDAGFSPFDFLIRNLDIFMMPTLFFIAGYFSLISIKKHGQWQFILAKLRKLGIPLLLGVLFVPPIHHFVYMNSRFDNDAYLWQFFSDNIESALTFYTGYLLSPIQFGHYHLWFISLLLFFFLVFASLYTFKSELFDNDSQATRKSGSDRSILLILFSLCIVSTIADIFLYKAVAHTPSKDPWLTIGGLIQIRPTQIGLHVICFGLGLYACRRQWFTERKPPGNIWLWTIATLGLWFAKSKLGALFVASRSGALGISLLFVRHAFFFCLLLLLISLAFKYFNKPSGVGSLLSANSYYIYLFHYPLVIVLQFMLLEHPLSPLTKFTLILPVAVLLSYSFSQYLARPFPRFFTAGSIAVFCILSIVIS